jgi:DnaJ-class molecular chaperone
MITVICATCGGTGDDKAILPEEFANRCDHCRGTGYCNCPECFDRAAEVDPTLIRDRILASAGL